MARKKSAVMTAPDTLYRDIRSVLESARSSAYRAVNTTMVQAYWQVGRLIVEHEQGGKDRARYGAALLDTLAQRLTADIGRGFTARNLRHMRAFYVAFPIRHALRAELVHGRKRGAARTESAVGDKPIQHAARAELQPVGLRPELSWTHYLDRYFRDPQALLKAVNGRIAGFNDGKPDADQITPFDETADAWPQLNKIAYVRAMLVAVGPAP